MKKIAERDTKEYICNPCLDEQTFWAKKSFACKWLTDREKKKSRKKVSKKVAKIFGGEYKNPLSLHPLSR